MLSTYLALDGLIGGGCLGLGGVASCDDEPLDLGVLLPGRGGLPADDRGGRELALVVVGDD
jgi:hypothetical protein